MQDWEHGRRLAVAKALRAAVDSEFKHEGPFADAVNDWIDEFWKQSIKPYPTRAEIRAVMDTLISTIEAEGDTH